MHKHGAETESQNFSATQRVLGILEALTRHENGASVRNIADAVGVSRSATHRILQLLAEDGVAEQGDHGMYRIGPRFVRIAARVISAHPLLRYAQSLMTELVDRIGETCYLASYSPDEHLLMYLLRVESRRPVRHVQALGEPLPLHSGAIGKAVLSALDDEVVDGLVLEAFTPYTIVDKQELRADLVLTRRRGYALSREERVLGVAGVAAPLLSSGTVVGGLTAGVPINRVSQEYLDTVGSTISKYAADLSSVMTAMGIRRF